MKFICPLAVVKDIGKSRHFYETLLGQKIKYDFGENITFHGDFSIHLDEHFRKLIGDTESSTAGKSHNFELYFESESIEEIYETLKGAGVNFLHGLEAQPWGQRVFRLYDPDGHIIEVGESMEAVVMRFHRAGMDIDSICEKSSMPREFIEGVIGKT